MGTSRPVSRILSPPKGRVAIHLRPLLPTAFAQARATYLTTRASSPHAPSQARRPSWSCSGRGLPSHPSHLGCWWSLTPPFHPDPAVRLGGLFSVALSRGSLRVGVAHRPALWSPDFPRPLWGRGHPADSSADQCTACPAATARPWVHACRYPDADGRANAPVADAVARLGAGRPSCSARSGRARHSRSERGSGESAGPALTGRFCNEASGAYESGVLAPISRILPACTSRSRCSGAL